MLGPGGTRRLLRAAVENMPGGMGGSGAGVVGTVAGSGTGTYADGTGTLASFGLPTGVSVTSDGTLLYVADQTTNLQPITKQQK